jgi:hypothetical protein
MTLLPVLRLQDVPELPPQRLVAAGRLFAGDQRRVELAVQIQTLLFGKAQALHETGLVPPDPFG